MLRTLCLSERWISLRCTAAYPFSLQASPMFWYTAAPYLLSYAERQCLPPLPCPSATSATSFRPLFWYDRHSVTLRTRHGESPITATRKSDFQLFVRTGVPYQCVPLHYGSSGGSTRHSTTLHSIARLDTPHPFGEAERKQSDKPTALFLPKAVWQRR